LADEYRLKLGTRAPKIRGLEPGKRQKNRRPEGGPNGKISDGVKFLIRVFKHKKKKERKVKPLEEGANFGQVIAGGSRPIHKKEKGRRDHTGKRTKGKKWCQNSSKREPSGNKRGDRALKKKRALRGS